MQSEDQSGVAADSHPAPILILGIMQRSGTNFLSSLLRLHPDCYAGGVIWEDFVVAYSDLLVRYADSLYERWNPAWRVEETMGPPDVLCEHLGDGVLSFLKAQASSKLAATTPVRRGPGHSSCSSKRLVTKTPSVRNLGHCFKLFPHAQLLIVVRDGRAVVESGVKSFGWHYEQAMQNWATAAQTVLQFDQDMRDTHHTYRIVRYEDLVSSVEDELRRIFSFLGLDSERYDFDAARDLPVIGSSELRQLEPKMHWKPVEKGERFRPTLRWAHWGRALHERFNWIGGQYLGRLGYAMHRYPTKQVRWTMWNVLMDARWRVKTGLRQIRALLSRVRSRLS